MNTFEEFWPHYCRLHSKRETRLAHAAGTTAAIVLAVAALAFRQPLLLLGAALADYAIAQLSHRVFEGNATRPWTHPLWHARAELRMFRLVCTGRMP